MRRAVLAAVASVIVTAAAPAFASPPSLTDPEVPPAPTQVEVRMRSPRTATALSLLGALLGPAMIYAAGHVDQDGNHESLANALGLGGAIVGMVGPSWGHWYGGKALTKGLGLRFLGAGLAFAGAMVELSCFWEDQCPEASTAAALLLGGAGVYVAGTVWDIATADDTVRRWNDKHLTVVPSAGGLALAGHF